MQSPKTPNSARKEESVCIVGTGYVGLTLALTLCDVGFRVTAIDKNQSLLDTLADGRSHFYEKGIDLLLKKYTRRLFFTDSAIRDKKSDVYIVCVGTPLLPDKSPNLAYLKAAAQEVGANLKKGDLVILRSTVPVGATRQVVLPVLEKASGLRSPQDFHLVYAPERTIEGKALIELRELPQIIGGMDDDSFVHASNLFRKTTHTIINVSSMEGAEMIKVMDNSFRDISFAISNEFALIAESLELDVVELIKAARMGYNRSNLFVPSPGVGGACLTKDPYILSHVSKQSGHEAELVGLGRKVNEYMPLHVAKRIEEFLKSSKKSDAKVFVMGFAFKGHPVTSDMRFSPTIDLVRQLKKNPWRLFGYDPAVPVDEIRETGVSACTVAEGFKDADAVVLMLNNSSFADLDIFSLLATCRKPVLFYDAWQIYNREEIRQVEGVRHIGVGYV